MVVIVVIMVIIVLMQKKYPPAAKSSIYVYVVCLVCCVFRVWWLQWLLWISWLYRLVELMEMNDCHIRHFFWFKSYIVGALLLPQFWPLLSMQLIGTLSCHISKRGKTIKGVFFHTQKRANRGQKKGQTATLDQY